MVLEVSPSVAKNEDTSDSMNARKRLPVALVGLVSGKARNTGPVARGKTSRPYPCWRFVQATQGWFSATGRMFLFAGLAALSVSLFPESAYGQRLLVGNTNQGASFGTQNTQDHAQAFTTGPNSTGYKLTSVEIELVTLLNSTASYNVRIYTNSSGAPGTSIGSLTKPATLTEGLNEFTTTGIDFDPSTTYFLVVDLNSSTGNSWRGALIDTEESGSANGWTLADKHLFRSRTSTGAWSEDNLGPLRVRVNGQNPPTVSIDNASAPENADFIQFTIRFSREVGYGIRLDFETLTTGTATAGTDYLAQPKVDFWMDKGEVRQRPFVRILDDSVNDAGETVIVQISNARLCDDPSKTINIARSQATGTIRNTDPIPLAFLGRLGRTAAVQVVEQVEERLRAPRESGLQAQLAGQELRRGMEREMGHHFLSQLQASAGARQAGMDGQAQAGLAGDGLRRMGLGSGDVLTGSAFEMNRQMHQGGTVSFWVRGLASQFIGQEGRLSLKGGVRTTLLGADWAQGPVVAGLLLSHKGAVGDYAGVSAGEITSSLTGLHPYLGYQATERVTLWGVIGYGRGALSLTPGAGTTLNNGLSMAMAAGGLRGELVNAGVGGFGLAFKADALWVGTGTEGVESPAGNLAAVEAMVTRVRTALETSRSYAFGRELSLQPSLEVGLRHDDGDAETGAGVDLAGSLIA